MARWAPLYYEKPLEIVSGRGRRVVDGEGRTYLDFYGGVAVNLLGHDVPEVCEAIEERLRTGVLHTSTFYLARAQVELAERIAERSGVGDPAVYFTCSGTEAVEAALLAATEYRRSNRVIALDRSYHGRTFGALSVTGDRRWQGSGLTPLDVAFADEKEDLGAFVAAAGPESVAALIAEPVQGVAGAVPLAPGRLESARDELDSHGIPLIIDEIQTGWGRTGRYWGYQWHDVHPDILVFAKGVANGLVLSGVVGRRDIMESLPMASLSTFGGNPLSATAAVATLGCLDAWRLTDNARRVGRHLRAQLDRRLASAPCVESVHGRGLLLGISFIRPGTGEPCPETARQVQEECRRGGLLVGLGGTHGNCLRLMPALTLTALEAHEGSAVIEESVHAALRKRPWRPPERAARDGSAAEAG
ncbi:aspartate aminotransferase family protein [Streptomyces qinglanensis]|uniref:aspartate aminotransferase family protein n=1 Tax=Streptomyces qinglanensis TaxID=943816 RepID=UPI003D72D543